MAVAGPGVGVRGRTVEDGAPAGAGIVVGDGSLEGVGKLVGESMTSGAGVLEEPGALPHPAAKKTSTLANHAMRMILRTIYLFPLILLFNQLLLSLSAVAHATRFFMARLWNHLRRDGNVFDPRAAPGKAWTIPSICRDPM